VLALLALDSLSSQLVVFAQETMTMDEEQAASPILKRSQQYVFDQMRRNAQIANTARERRMREARAAAQRRQQQIVAIHQHLMRLDRIVGTLPADLRKRLGISTEEREVRLAFSGRVHIDLQRKRGRPDDREFVARYVEQALCHAILVESLPQACHFRFVCSLEGQGRLLAVVVKFVPAARAGRAVDEWWVATAYPYSAADMRRIARRSGVLRLRGLDTLVEETSP
jgi:hypothetical protein